MPVTIAESARLTEYAPSVATTNFDVGFPIVEADDIQVWHNGALVDSGDYSVTLGTLASGFYSAATVVLSAGVTGTVQIVGARQPKRTNNLTEGQGVPASTLNQQFNRTELSLRELYDKLSRAVVLKPGSSQSEIGLTAKAVLKVNDAGTGVELGPSYDVLVGSSGPTGPTGPTGATGATGPAGAGSGDVLGPGGGSTDNAVARWDLATGTQLQDSGVTIDDDDNLAGVNNVSGADGTFVTGTKGGTAELAMWNEDGDAVGAGISVTSQLQAILGATAFGGLTLAADKLPYATGADAIALADFPAVGRTLVSKTTIANARAYLVAAARTQATESIPIFIRTGENVTEDDFINYFPHDATITAIYAKARAGTITYQLRKNGANLGASQAITPAATQVDQTGLSLSVAAGDRFGFALSSNASAQAVSIVIIYTRLLA